MKKIQFLTDPELIKFADWFSRNHKKLSLGNYLSDEKNYHIELIEDIKSEVTKQSLNRLCHIGKITNKIQFSKKQLENEKNNDDFVFYSIINCIAIKEFDGDLQLADIASIKYYLSTKRSRKNVAIGILECFSNNLSGYNVGRWELIKQFIDEHENIRN